MSKEKELEDLLAAYEPEEPEGDDLRPQWAGGDYSKAIGSFVDQSKRLAKAEREIKRLKDEISDRESERADLRDRLDKAEEEIQWMASNSLDLRSRLKALANGWATYEPPDHADDRQRAYAEAANSCGDLLNITIAGPTVVKPVESSE